MEWIDEEIIKEKQETYFKFFSLPFSYVVLFALINIIFVFVVFKYSLIEFNKWSLYAEKNRTLKVKISAPRGLIYDRNNNIIADNVPSFDLIVNLAALGKKDFEYINKIIQENNLNYEIIDNTLYAKNLKKELAFQLMIKYGNSLDVRVNNSYIRRYKFKESFGNLLGYLGFPNENEIKNFNVEPQEFVGKMGIEKEYQNYLKGKDGSLELEKDVKADIIKIIKKIEPLPGYNLKLAIDANLQEKAYEIMDKYMKENGYKKGGVIIMNPHTGEILALISYPSFDSNIFIENNKEKIKEVLNNPFHPLFNRPISGLYAPGSVVKPILAIAALEEKIISPDKKIYSSGSLRIPNPYFPNTYSVFRDWKAHGWVDMKKAIANSVNVYFYTIGGGYGDQPGLGIYKIKKYFALFGLGKKTQIDFPGENEGFLPDPETKKKNIFDPIWRLGDTYNVSIGQGDLTVTPLQIAVFTSALATNKLIVPFLVKEILDQNNHPIYIRRPIIIKEKLVNEENLRIVQEGMRMTVTEGTAKILNDFPIPIAGKSGTPQILGKKKLNAFFTGYAPYPNPEIVLVVFIEEVPEGSVATLPLYKELMKLYFQNHPKYKKLFTDYYLNHVEF